MNTIIPIIANIQSESNALLTLSGLVAFLVFSVASVALFVLGVKALDKFTPGDLIDQIVNHKNIAAAIFAVGFMYCLATLFVAAMS